MFCNFKRVNKCMKTKYDWYKTIALERMGNQNLKVKKIIMESLCL